MTKINEIMKKIIRLTESDLVRIVKRVINENSPTFKVGARVRITNIKSEQIPTNVINFNGKICNIDNDGYATVKGEGEYSNKCWWGNIGSENIIDNNTIYDGTMKKTPNGDACFKCSSSK